MNLVLVLKATGSGQKMAKTKIVQKTHLCGFRRLRVNENIDVGVENNESKDGENNYCFYEGGNHHCYSPLYSV